MVPVLSLELAPAHGQPVRGSSPLTEVRWAAASRQDATCGGEVARRVLVKSQWHLVTATVEVSPDRHRSTGRVSW
jgi:hypothetical protein